MGRTARAAGRPPHYSRHRFPDLTRIAKVDEKFPALRVQRIISGVDVIGAHGSRETPA